MQIHCRSCRAKVLADDVNLEKALAKCRGCHAVFDFRDQLEKSPRPRPPVPLPSKFRVVDLGRELEISWKWFSPAQVFLAFFCVAWDSFLVFWYVMAFKEGAAWIMKVFPLAHLAVGVGLTYATLAGFWNRTVVRITADGISIRHGPIPWRGNRIMPSTEIEQIYCEEQRGRSSPGGRIGAYSVNALTRDGRKVTLLRGLEEADQALYIEQAMEAGLGLEDRPVGGELPR